MTFSAVFTFLYKRIILRRYRASKCNSEDNHRKWIKVNIHRIDNELCVKCKMNPRRMLCGRPRCPICTVIHIGCSVTGTTNEGAEKCALTALASVLFFDTDKKPPKQKDNLR